MENLPLTSHARHPLLYTMIPSLDFRQGSQKRWKVWWHAATLLFILHLSSIHIIFYINYSSITTLEILIASTLERASSGAWCSEPRFELGPALLQQAGATF
jgi:hypothetical protein